MGLAEKIKDRPEAFKPLDKSQLFGARRFSHTRQGQGSRAASTNANDVQMELYQDWLVKWGRVAPESTNLLNTVKAESRRR